jgi:hypothetical protein
MEAEARGRFLPSQLPPRDDGSIRRRTLRAEPFQRRCRSSVFDSHLTATPAPHDAARCRSTLTNARIYGVNARRCRSVRERGRISRPPHSTALPPLQGNEDGPCFIVRHRVRRAPPRMGATRRCQVVLVESDAASLAPGPRVVHAGSVSLPFFDRSGSVHAARLKQQGGRFPLFIFEMLTSTRRLRVSGFGVALTPRTHSPRCQGNDLN